MTIATPVLAAILFVACLIATTVLIVSGNDVPAEVKLSMVACVGAAIGSAIPGTLKLG